MSTPIDSQPTVAKYVETSEISRLGFAHFVDRLTTLESLPPLCFANFLYADWRAHPSEATFHGFEVLVPPKTVAPPRASNALPENWYFSQYNQPREISTFYVRDARITAGQFRRPKGTQAFFAGEKLGFHEGQACLLLPNGDLFEGSFALQDGQRNLPGQYFELEGGTLLRRPDLVLQPQPERIEGTHYFLGNFLTHWGHFLLDGMSRLWFLKFVPEEVRRTMKFICFDREFPGWAWDLLKPFGVDRSNVIFSKRDMLVENLIVPLDSYRTHLTAHTEYQTVLNQVKAYYAPSSESGRKIFLSRRNQPSRKLENELELEEFFADLGFEVIIPEAHSVAEQVKLASEAAVLAGATGSGMYLAGFQPAGAKTLIFGPRSFFLFDDYLFATIGKRKIGFVLGEPFDVHDKFNSAWRLNFDDQAKDYVRNFVSEPLPAKA